MKKNVILKFSIIHSVIKYFRYFLHENKVNYICTYICQVIFFLMHVFVSFCAISTRINSYRIHISNKNNNII